ncbi:hypothetical protein SEVIR_4G012450v4 [Setaria viridis]
MTLLVLLLLNPFCLGFESSLLSFMSNKKCNNMSGSHVRLTALGNASC